MENIGTLPCLKERVFRSNYFNDQWFKLFSNFVSADNGMYVQRVCRNSDCDVNNL